MKKQCIVIGLGRFGTSVAETLTALDHDVLAVDIKEDNVRHISDKVFHAVQADIREEEVFDSLGLDNMDVAVVGIGEEVESSCMAIMGLKRKGVKYIIAKAKSEIVGKILTAVGADRVIYPERDMGVRVAHNIFSNNILDFFEFSDDYSIIEVCAPKWTIGETIESLKVREKHHVNIIAIKSFNGTVNAEVQRDTVIRDGDTLVMLGADKHLYAFK